MRRSMTAYGRAAIQTKQAHWIVEIASVNRKGLDIHLHLPHTLLFLDPIIRKWVGHIAERGNITIRISCEMKDVSALAEQLKHEKKRWEEVARALNIAQDQVTLSFLLTQIAPQSVAIDCEKEIAQAWKKASQAWLTMKEQEGKVLTHDIQTRLKLIEQEMKRIEKELPKVMKERLARLAERMKEFNLSIDIDRGDVTEEIVRLKSHMEQLMLYLKSTEKSVGKTLDFLSQEMGREIGTLMAKAGSTEIAQTAVRIKSEIEKIREQVQNIE